MKAFESTIRLFSESFTLREAFENHLRVELVVNLPAIAVPEISALQKVFLEFPSNDDVTIDIHLGPIDPISIYSKTIRYDEFRESLNAALSLMDVGDAIRLKVTVHKKETAHFLNVYDSKVFWSFVLKERLSNQLKILNSLIQQKALIINCLDEQITFETQAIVCRRNGVISHDNSAQTEKRIDSINTVCHYANISDLKLLAEDFKLTKKSDDGTVNKFFDKLALLHCIISIFDITEIDGNSISYKLNGFKSFTGTFEFSDLQTSSLEDFYKIYKWTYEGGNLSDKVGLVRNIISIHIAEGKVFHLTGSPYHSIRSGYDIYLKQNIRQYIEIRNKITDQLTDFSKKANAIVDDFAKNFKMSMFTFISFFVSVFVLRVLSTGNFENVMTMDATIMCLGFLIICAVFLKYARWELAEQKDRLKKGYANLKDRYKDLLVEGDINRILNNDRDHLDDLEFIDEKKKIYTRMWCWVLGIFLVVIIIISLRTNLQP